MEERFQSLAVVKQAKPHIPQEEPKSPRSDSKSPRSPRFTPISSPGRRTSRRVGQGLSHAFQGLINQVIVQHCYELQELQARASESHFKVRTSSKLVSMDPEVAYHTSQDTSFNKSGGTENMENTSYHSYEDNTTERDLHEWAIGRRKRSGPLSPSLVKKNEALEKATASEIIKNLQEEEQEKLESAEKQNELPSRVGNALARLTGQKSGVDGDSEESEPVDYTKLSRFQKLQAFLQSNTFEMMITIFLLFNVLWMAAELQVNGSMNGFTIGFYAEPIVSDASWPAVESFLSVGDLFFSAFFALDVTVRLLVLRFQFFRVCMNYIDLGVTVASLAEIFIFAATPSGFVNPVLFRLLRIGKLARALRMVTMSNVLASLQLLLKCLATSMDMLFWTFCLLTFLQCVAGMIVSTLARDFIVDEGHDIELRLEVFRYYGTFTRTFLSMFEILFANWAPPCRAVVEAISEWFSVFFLLYRCVLGFAVLNVVNAVFVQQTMKTASSDEDLAFKQKQKDAAVYNRKVKKLFQTMDASGDGAINLEEFAKLVKSPKLKFWMSQLELEYHDLLSLFEFLDNGDGQITLKEFTDGASRLRGGAKALDIWRLETKVEVLFEELLRLHEPEPLGELPKFKSVHDVFAQSTYRHIGSAVKLRNDRSERSITPGSEGEGEGEAL